MGRYLFRRAWQSALTLVVVVILVFLGVRALPGDPALALAGEDRSPAALAAIRHEYGLDKPLPVQFWRYVEQLLHGNLGHSINTGASVTSMLGTALPVTLELTALAIVIASIIGIGAGVLAAVRRGKPIEWFANGFALIGLSVPHFWLGLLAILYLSVGAGIFPASGFVSIWSDPVENLHHIILPAVILGTGLSAVLMRQTRSAMVDALNADYIRTAKAKGNSPFTVYAKHALANALMPVITIVGLQTGAVLTGTVITETIFDWPGLGSLLYNAIQQRDYPLVQGCILLVALIYVLVNLLTDLASAAANPRIRLS